MNNNDTKIKYDKDLDVNKSLIDQILSKNCEKSNKIFLNNKNNDKKLEAKNHQNIQLFKLPIPLIKLTEKQLFQQQQTNF
jgi:hypothetical protein